MSFHLYGAGWMVLVGFLKYSKNMQESGNVGPKRTRALWKKKPSIDNSDWINSKRQEIGGKNGSNQVNKFDCNGIENGESKKVTTLRKQFETSDSENGQDGIGQNDYSGFLGWIKNDNGIYERRVRFRLHNRTDRGSMWRHSIGGGLGKLTEEEDCQNEPKSQLSSSAKLWPSTSTRQISTSPIADTHQYVADKLDHLVNMRKKLQKSRDNLACSQNGPAMVEDEMERVVLRRNPTRRGQYERASICGDFPTQRRQTVAVAPHFRSSVSSPVQSIPDSQIPSEQCNSTWTGGMRRSRPISWASFDSGSENVYSDSYQMASMMRTNEDDEKMKNFEMMARKCYLSVTEFRVILEGIVENQNQVGNRVSMRNGENVWLLNTLTCAMEECAEKMKAYVNRS